MWYCSGLHGPSDSPLTTVEVGLLRPTLYNGLADFANHTRQMLVPPELFSCRVLASLMLDSSPNVFVLWLSDHAINSTSIGWTVMPLWNALPRIVLNCSRFRPFSASREASCRMRNLRGSCGRGISDFDCTIVRMGPGRRDTQLNCTPCEQLEVVTAHYSIDDFALSPTYQYRRGQLSGSDQGLKGTVHAKACSYVAVSVLNDSSFLNFKYKMTNLCRPKHRLWELTNIPGGVPYILQSILQFIHPTLFCGRIFAFHII